MEEAQSGRPGRGNSTVKSIRDISPEDLAVTALRILLDGLDRPRKFQGLALAIGHQVFAEAGLKRWAAESPQLIKAITRTFNTRSEAHHYRILRAAAARHSVDLRIPSKEQLYRVGAYLIHHICAHTGFFERSRVHEGSNRNPDYVQPTRRLLEWVRAHHSALAAEQPAFSPLLVRPKPWARGANGGYHFALANTVTFLANTDRQTAKGVRDLCGPEPFAAINHLQSTRWRINKRVYEIYRQVVLTGGNLGGLSPFREQPLPPHPDLPKGRQWSPEEQERHDRWVKQAHSLHTLNATIRRKALREFRTLALADKLVHEDGFYFACQFDFRGRIYYLSPDLHPQGRDIHKALLEFADDGTVGSEEGAGEGLRKGLLRAPEMERALALHLTGRIGKCPFTGDVLDKGSVLDRTEWCNVHADILRRTADAPLSNLWWAEATDDPWQTLAAVFAFAAGECGRLPLQIDGTCNGYQHLAAISGDVGLARAVNVLPAGDVPRDIYIEVAAALGLQVHGHRSALGPLAGPRGILERKSVKRPIMTIPYGATAMSIADGFEEIFHARGIEGDIRKNCVFLAQQLVETLNALYPETGKVRDYILSLCKLVSAVQADLQWVSPSGFPVMQRYRKVASKKIEVQLGNRLRMQHRLGTYTDQLEARRSSLGSAPNVLQSLDAAHLHKTAMVCAQRGIEIGGIHDCLLMRASDAAEVGRIVREQFIETHREPFLEKLAEQVAPVVIGRMPEVPKRGPLRLEDVLESEFFFS